MTALATTRLERTMHYVSIALGIPLWLASLCLLPRLSAPSLLWLLAAAFILFASAGRLSFRLPLLRSHLTLGEPILFAALLFLGPAPAITISGLDGLCGVRRDRQRLRHRVSSAGMMSLSAAAGSLAFVWMRSASSGPVPSVNDLVAPNLAAALAHFAVNTALVAAVAAARTERRFIAVWRDLAWALPSYVISAGAALLALACSSTWGALSLLFGLPAVALVYGSYRTRVDRQEEHRRHVEDLQLQSQRAMEALALAIESRDPLSRGHCQRVQAYALEIGKLVVERNTNFGSDASLSPEWLTSLSSAALLHDVGKLGLPDHLLYRSGPLLRTDRERIQQHTVLGEAIVSRLLSAYPLGPIVRHHHEHWDGTGYPDGLRGEAIPLAARILALADSLDGLRRTRPEGSPPSIETLLMHVARHAGTRLDPRLAELYCEHAEAIEASVQQRDDQLHVAAHSGPQEKELMADIGSVRREALVIYDLARNLGSSLDLNRTLHLTLQSLSSLMPSGCSSALYLSDDQGTQAVPREALGPLAPELLRRSFARSEGVTGWVLETREAVVGADPRIDLGADAERLGRESRSAAVFPLADEDGLLGVVSFYADERQSFEPRHRRTIEAVIPQVVRAIRNAQLFESTRSTSMTDALTGLPNSRYLYSEVEKEMARATRRARPLCVVVMDLDGFKPINDTYGHRAGDSVLRHVAVMLRETFRSDDIVVRYAGDEFVALLPETSPEEAKLVVGRVQQAVEESPLRLEDGNVVSVGLSAGTSCFPIDGSTLEDLIHRADKEMYRDKAERKRVERPEVVEGQRRGA